MSQKWGDVLSIHSLYYKKKGGGGYFHFGTVSNHISALDPTISRLWIQPYLGTVPNHISILYLTISRYCTPPCLGNVPHHVSVLYPTKSRYCLWLDTVLRCGLVVYQNVVLLCTKMCFSSVRRCGLVRYCTVLRHGSVLY